MKALKLAMVSALAVFLFTQCEKDEMTESEMKNAKGPNGMFTVKIENISKANYAFYESGVFNTPDYRATISEMKQRLDS